MSDSHLRERFSLGCRGAIFALSDWQRDAAAARSSVPRTGLPGFASDLITITAAGLASVRERERRFTPFAVPRTGARTLEGANRC